MGQWVDQVETRLKTAPMANYRFWGWSHPDFRFMGLYFSRFIKYLAIVAGVHLIKI